MTLTVEERITLRDTLFDILYELSVITLTKLKHYRITRKSKLTNALEKNAELKEKFSLYVSQFRSEDEAIYCLINKDDISNHICENCKSNISCFYIKNGESGYRKTCGKLCAQKLIHSDAALDKQRDTFIKKYGTDNPMKVKEVQEKAKSTWIEKYGTDNPMKNKEIKDKVKQTNIERYGYSCSSKNEEVKKKQEHTNLIRYGYKSSFQNIKTREKFKQNMLRRYGVTNSMHIEGIKEKVKKTCLDRYGVEYTFQSPEIRAKSIQTCLKRYGVKHPAQSIAICNKRMQTCLRRYGYKTNLLAPSNISKSKSTCLKKYGVEFAAQSEKIKAKYRNTCIARYNRVNGKQLHINNYSIWSNDSVLKSFILKLYHSKGVYLRINDLTKVFNVFGSTIKYKIEQLGLLEYFYIPESNLEAKFKEFLNSNNIQYKMHDRKTLLNSNTNNYMEIDFLLKEYSIGFEINDIGTHNSIESLSTYKDKYYHSLKTSLANRNSIRLIHIWEWELRDEDYKSKLFKWILNILNNNKDKASARKCVVKNVSVKEEKEFLNNYHLQGYKKSEICLGLYYNDNLIQLMSFCKPRYNKKYEWELLRLCTKYGYSVIGGSNRLLKNFIKLYNPKSIISYCDLSKFNGHVYEDIGFKLVKITKPQITWCNKDMKHFSQSSLTLIGADKLLGTNFGKGASNEEIAIKCGYLPIYNCGLGVYVYG